MSFLPLLKDEDPISFLGLTHRPMGIKKICERAQKMAKCIYIHKVISAQSERSLLRCNVRESYY